MMKEFRALDREIEARSEDQALDPTIPAPPAALDRRSFLRRSAGMAGGATLALTLQEFLGRSAKGDSPGPGYGPLFPKADRNTGLELLELPEGFEYVSFGWRGDPLRGQLRTLWNHDGMAAFPVGPYHVVLIRNHEMRRSNVRAQRGAPVYDPWGGGGTSNLLFNMKTGQLENAWQSLSGTDINCAGGPTPWGTWLTCEETFALPPTRGYTKTHGWVFEVPVFGWARPVPIREMGWFSHEAVAIDPMTNIVYETEDQHTSGFYRFIPNVPGQLQAGGRLEMLSVAGQPMRDLRGFMGNGAQFPVEWVPIHDPALVRTTPEPLGVFKQGLALGGAIFARLEGCWYSPDNGKIYINATTGGGVDPTNNRSVGAGQVWEYDPVNELLTCIFQSPDNETLDNPDNLAISPRTGGLILCEDGSLDGQRLQVMTVDGRLAPFARSNIVIPSVGNPKPGIAPGDYRGAEWAGACFASDADGRQWLFVNNFAPGITFAITGDWSRGGL
ncbi:MAG: phosphatase [Isosphaeraceae bacterium]|jgi:secreted PhoX family phosphatase|nr:MAG: phosphatase [Isosphaeraceae bacterium]